MEVGILKVQPFDALMIYIGLPWNSGKLGLLPKRPISLVREPPQAKPQQIQRRDSDDDDLEYAENPFEESKK